MTQHRYLLAYNLNYRVNIFVSVLHVRIHMEDIDIHPKIVLIDIVKNRYTAMNYELMKTLFLIPNFGNAISSIIEILQFTVKIACKMTFYDY